MTAIRCGRMKSCALYGIEGIMVDIEVTILPGLPAFEIVGLGDSAVRESRNRVHAAIRNNGFIFPASRVTACYAPAWLRKEGSSFDLPLALTILMASGQVCVPDRLVCAFGELSLVGEVRKTPGTICRVSSCRKHHEGPLLVPADNAAEAGLVSNQSCMPVSSLREAAELMNMLAEGMDARELARKQILARRPHNIDKSPAKASQGRIMSIAGQQKAVKAMRIASAGHHNLLLLGSPGCGKSTLAAMMPGLLPPLSPDEAQLVTRIYSASGMLNDDARLITCRPFRAPHHTISRQALIGGGAIPVPGEVSLAHLGVLFLDEMTEFQPDVLDLLRQPAEERCVRLARLRHSMTYPADFILVGAANPCRCGEYLEPNTECRCSEQSVKQHMGRLSGPLLDRIDLVVEMNRLSETELQDSVLGNRPSAGLFDEMARSVDDCRQIQIGRCKSKDLPVVFNGRQHYQFLAETLDIDGKTIVYAAKSAARLNLTARAYHKVLRVARTIADLAGSIRVEPDHVAEAMQYRMRIPS